MNLLMIKCKGHVNCDECDTDTAAAADKHRANDIVKVFFNDGAERYMMVRHKGQSCCNKCNMDTPTPHNTG